MSGSGVVVRVVVSALVAAVVGTAASAAAAEPEPAPIEVGALTSRPGVGDTAQAMPLGAIIVNPGLTVSGPPVSVGAPSPSTAPDILVRVGIAHGVEARGAVSFDAVGKSVVMSPSFALAGQLLTESDFVPAMLGIVTLSLPTAADPTALGGELRISEAKGFGQFGIGSNAALSVEATGAALSGTLGASMALRPGMSPFLEIFGDGRFYPVAASFELGADAGVGVQITRTVAVDVSAGGTFLGTQSLFVSVGASFLWL